MSRYTFAVCHVCGVQSPPVIFDKNNPVGFGYSLGMMGWRIDHQVIATCPVCLENAEKQAS